MNWFGGDSKKEEKKKLKEQQKDEDLAVRQAEHARNQRMKHLSGVKGAPDPKPAPKTTESETIKPNEIDVPMLPMQEEIGQSNFGNSSNDVPMSQSSISESKPIPQSQSSNIQNNNQNNSNNTKQQINQGSSMTEEKLIHTWISDVYLITNESGGPQKSGQQPKTFLYEFCQDGKMFALDDLDIILCNRLGKQRDENKFDYLFKAYERIDSHIVAKMKKQEAKINEMKDITTRYFITCLIAPDTFDLNNNLVEFSDKAMGAGGFGGGQQDMEQMMQAAMMGGMMPGFGNPESLGSDQTFEFLQMQINLWQALKNTQFVFNRQFMMSIQVELKEDPGTMELFYTSIFDQMHLQLSNIRQETFGLADTNVQLINSLLEFDGAAEAFVASPNFLNKNLNGSQIAKCTYLGRYLSFSAIVKETKTWRQSDMNVNFHKMKPEQHSKHMDQVAGKFSNFHSNIADLLKKLMKNAKSKDKVLEWMRMAITVNMDKQKMFTHTPVASDGFVLNFIDLLLQLCKPFISNFSKYGQFISRINCFYLMTDDYIGKARKMEKIGSPDTVDDITAILNGKKKEPLNLSGVTQTQILVEASSLMDDNPSAAANLSPPNFVTECFFMAHILISFVGKKLEEFYRTNNENVNKAIEAKDWQAFDDLMATRLCNDAHIFGKATISLYRQLFSFTNAILICTGDRLKVGAETFKDLFHFMDQVKPYEQEVPPQPLAMDFLALPQFILSNLSTYPTLFKQIQADVYFGADQDLQMQLMGMVSMLMNRPAGIVHTRLDLVKFPLHLVPMKTVSKHHERENRLYKDVFFVNPGLKKYFMHALLIVYVESEKLDSYTKPQYRFAAAHIMEYIWSDDTYRKRFIELSKNYPQDFNALCNLFLNDTNSLLFDGLLALEEIKKHESLKEDDYAWSQLAQEEKEQAEQHFHSESRKAKGSLQLSNMVIQLLSKVTKHCPEPFISNALGEKFAQAINFCLDQLTTQKGLKFKIKNPERFYFEPKALLVNLITMYANMAQFEKFRDNVVLDGRSYSDETFAKALKILNSTQKNVAVDEDAKEKFEVLVTQLKDAKQKAAQNEIDYDDAPEEFFDPLMATIMDDPVELPDSHYIIDRVTIEQHLLNDKRDPMSRSPLSLDQLIPRPDIKAKIEEYKNEKKALKMSMK